MNRKWNALIIMMILIAPSALTIASWQDNTATNYHRTSAGGSATTGITEQRAIIIAQQHFKGRVLAIHQIDRTYRIKILSDQGAVQTILINAQDGSVVAH